jgi:hypothetical protein
LLRRIIVSRAAGDRTISDDISLSRIYILCQKFGSKYT